MALVLGTRVPGQVVRPDTGLLQFTGQAPALPLAISPAVGQLQLTGLAPTIQAGSAGGGAGLNLFSLRPAGWGTSVATTIMLTNGEQTPPGGPFTSDRPFAGTNGLFMIFHDFGNWRLFTDDNPVTGGSSVLRATLPAGTYGTLGQGSSRGLGNIFGTMSNKTKAYFTSVFRVTTNQGEGVLPSGWCHPVSLKWFGIETSGHQVFVQLHEGGNWIRGEEATVNYFIPPNAAHVNLQLPKATWLNFEAYIDLQTGVFQAAINGVKRFDAVHTFDETVFGEMNQRLNYGGGDIGVVANDIHYDFGLVRFEYAN